MSWPSCTRYSRRLLSPFIRPQLKRREIPSPSDGAEILDRGVATLGAVEALHVVEDRRSQLPAGLLATPVQQLQLEGSQKRLGKAIVEAIADGAHGAEQAGGPKTSSECPRAVLGAVVRVTDGLALRWLAAPDGSGGHPRRARSACDPRWTIPPPDGSRHRARQRGRAFPSRLDAPSRRTPRDDPGWGHRSSVAPGPRRG